MINSLVIYAVIPISFWFHRTLFYVDISQACVYFVLWSIVCEIRSSDPWDLEFVLHIVGTSIKICAVTINANVKFCILFFFYRNNNDSIIENTLLVKRILTTINQV